MKKTYVLVALLGVTSFAFAQEQAIDTVNVQARKKVLKERAEFLRHGQSVETLSSYELNRNDPALIEQTLSTMSGVQVDKRTFTGGQRVVIRGYGNDQKFNNWGIKFYWNNMPLTNAEGVTVLDDVDFSFVNNIELIKGPASTMYGGGTGGTVRFYTRPEFSKGYSVSQNTMFGSFKTFQSRTDVTASDSNYNISASYNHLETNGYRPNGGGLKNFFNVNGTIKLSDKDNLSFFGSQAYSYEKTSGQISYADYYAGIDNGNPAYIRKNSGTKIKSTRIGLSNWWNISKNFRNQTTLFYYNGNTESISAGAYGVTSAPNVGLRSTFVWKESFNDFASNLEFGTEIQNSQSTTSSYRFTGSITNPLETTGINGASYFKYNNNSANYFAIEHLTYKPWDLTLLAGLSINDVNFHRKDLFALPNLIPNKVDQSFDKTYKTAYTPHFALQKKWGKQLFNLSYSEGYNAPTSSSSYISGPNITNNDLKPERAKMVDFSIQGLDADTKLDYQVSVFRIDYQNKLTQLASSFTTGTTTTNYSYWANTGDQRNHGIEASIGYNYQTPSSGFLKSIQPFFNMSYYDARYKDFNTLKKVLVDPTLPGNVAQKPNEMMNYKHYQVVGVPRVKLAAGLDIQTKLGFYLYNTYNYLGDVYTDFANTNKVKGFGLLNSKLGYKKSFGHWDLDAYVMGNNLTNQLNYTFLFLGNSVGDSDTGNGYPKGTVTDINPGPKKAYFFGGLNLKYRF